MVFLPRDFDERNRIQNLFADIATEEGQKVLGWRDVPTDDSALGETAKSGKPVIRQVFFGRSSSLDDQPEAHEQFERKLYVIRKRVDHTVKTLSLSQQHLFYIVSLSSNTIVYKGMLIADQVEGMFPGPGESIRRIGARSRSPAILHEHVSVVAARSSVSLRSPQR